MLELSIATVKDRVKALGDHLTTEFRVRPLPVYGVPRGGTIVAMLLEHVYPGEIVAVDDHELSVVIVDDIIDSGRTKEQWALNTDKPFYAIHTKTDLDWVVFPWEKRDQDGVQSSGEDIATRLLEFIGEDPKREGLLKTPERFVKAWRHWTSGYGQDPTEVLHSFADGAERYDEMILLRDIPIWSHCVVGSTFVETPRGRIPICRLNDGDWVYTMDPKTFELGVVQCHNPRMTRSLASVVAVHTGNDTLICTPDHKVLLLTGEWMRADQLKNGDRLASLYRAASTQYATVNKDSLGVYLRLVSSRFTRWGKALSISGKTKSMLEHAFIADKLLAWGDISGRRQVIHHIDECLWDNLANNLELLSVSEHNRRYKKTQRLADSLIRKRVAALASGRPEVRAKRSASVKAYWDSLSREERAARANHVVFGVEPLSYKEDVWCMDVLTTSLFFANGIAVHNCEHHLAPFFGTATVAYIPNNRIVGLSKISRLIDVFSHRLQVQERLTNQVADALFEGLQPLGVGVALECRHTCMESRGIEQAGIVTSTCALRGVFHSDVSAKAEFLAGVRKK